jgi:hypothetical protein
MIITKKTSVIRSSVDNGLSKALKQRIVYITCLGYTGEATHEIKI